MVFDVIKQKGYTLHSTMLENVDREYILERILNMVSFFRPGQVDRNYQIPGAIQKIQPGPGVQMWLAHLKMDDEVHHMEKLAVEAIKETEALIQGRKIKETYHTSWTFISTDKNSESLYHDHTYYMKEEPAIGSTYTYVYYLQMPDNLEGDEGKIFFDLDENDDTAFKYLPKEGEMLIFPGYVPHRPAINPNSTKSRVVIAGNIAFQFEKDTLL